jgi:hypothetical protein
MRLSSSFLTSAGPFLTLAIRGNSENSERAEREFEEKTFRSQSGELEKVWIGTLGNLKKYSFSSGEF